MGTRMLVFGLASLSALVGAAALANLAAALYRRRKATLNAQGEKMSARALVLWRLRNGYAFLAPVADALLASKRASRAFEDAQRLLEGSGVAATTRSLATVVLAAAFSAALAVGLVTGSPIAALAVSACLCAFFFVAIANMRDKRQEAAQDSVPAALESMAACFASGFTLEQTFQQVAHDIDEPLSSTFARAAHILEMGGGADRALDELKRDSSTSELAFVAVALDVQHQSGGAMRQVLQAATETVKGELALRRSLRVQTAQAKLSARVVVVMPFILVALFSLASPDFLMPFFQSVQGYALLALAVIMQLSGIVLVRRALSVEGVS